MSLLSFRYSLFICHGNTESRDEIGARSLRPFLLTLIFSICARHGCNCFWTRNQFSDSMIARDILRAIEVSNELIGTVLSCIFMIALYRTSYFHGNLRFVIDRISKGIHWCPRSILYAFSIFLIGMNLTNVALVVSTQLRGLFLFITLSIMNLYIGSYDRKTQMNAVINDSRIIIEGLFERVWLQELSIIFQILKFREQQFPRISIGSPSQQYRSKDRLQLIS